MASLFRTIHADEENFPPDVVALLDGEAAVSEESPAWPTLTYLTGEAYLRRGETESARAAFRSLATWAVSEYPGGPYGDTWGGSGLAIVGLWRWLQLLDEHGPEEPEELDRLLEVASQLQETRLYSGMVQTGLLPALPLLEERVAGLLAHVAWKNQRFDKAIPLYLDFLALDSRELLDETGKEIHNRILERGLATRDRLDLYRARRQLGLVRPQTTKDPAAQVLKQLYENQDALPDVRAVAGYEWANYMRRRGNRGYLIKVLTEVLDLVGDSPVAEQALFRRGTVYGDGEGFLSGMLAFMERFPKSPLADDALNQLAANRLFQQDLDGALSYYKQLQEFNGPHDFEDSAYFFPAMGLVGRGGEGDLEAADQLLDAYLSRYPNGVFRLRSLFWRGRIAERRNDLGQTRDFFQLVVDEAPYNYYALRARMHLEEDVEAIRKSIPAEDSETRRALGDTYRESRLQVATRLDGSSAYHERLRTAASTGLYRQLLDIDAALGGRLDDIPLEQLDARDLVPAAVLLVALRQDALAAKDYDLDPDNWLQLSALLSSIGQDWPTAVEMTFPRGDEERQRLTELQKELPYLATVYSDLEGMPSLTEPLAAAAWPIEGSTSLSQSLMYAIMRHESRFYAGAISAAGALGLFQFMPETFRELDEKWGLLQISNKESSVDYLLDPGLNTELWARWVAYSFPINNRDGIALSVMKHQAG